MKLEDQACQADDPFPPSIDSRDMPRGVLGGAAPRGGRSRTICNAFQPSLHSLSLLLIYYSIPVHDRLVVAPFVSLYLSYESHDRIIRNGKHILVFYWKEEEVQAF